MNPIRCGIVLGAASLILPFLAHADVVMTFDALDADFADHTSHVENGITFEAVDGPGEFFRADGFFGDTSAAIFISDGDPMEIRYGGGPFTLGGLDFEDIGLDTVALLTGSNGETATVGAPGTFLAAGLFSGVTWVQLSFDAVPGADPYYVVDNITVVPEASTWGAAAVLVTAAWLSCRRGRGTAKTIVG